MSEGLDPATESLSSTSDSEIPETWIPDLTGPAVMAASRKGSHPSYASVIGSTGPMKSKIQKSHVQKSPPSQQRHAYQANISERDSLSPSEHPEIRHDVPSTAIYIRGIPYMPISQVKRLLSQRPVCIQIHYIRNISWLDRTMVELLVNQNHAVQMKNRISRNQDFHVRTSFDPLSPTSYNWETEVTPETQENILKEDFVNRIASSIASTHVDSTRRYLMEWGRNRGMGQPLEAALSKHYKIPTAKKSFPRDMASTVAFEIGKETKTTGIKLGVTQGAKLLTSHKRQLTTSESIER